MPLLPNHLPLPMNLKKLETGNTSFDHISHGGLPIGRTTLVAGSSGSATTLFGAQFLALGIQLFNQPGVFATFKEQVHDIPKNLKSLNYNIHTCEKEEKCIFVPASPNYENIIPFRDLELTTLCIKLEREVETRKAQRVLI